MFGPQLMPLVALAVTLRTETPTAGAHAIAREASAPGRSAVRRNSHVLSAFKLDPPNFAASAACRIDVHVTALLSRPAAHTEIPRVRRIRGLDAMIDRVTNVVWPGITPPIQGAWRNRATKARLHGGGERQ
jgi:hypothetical protein